MPAAQQPAGEQLNGWVVREFTAALFKPVQDGGYRAFRVHLREMRERSATLQGQMEAAIAEIAQRQSENLQLAEQLLALESERNAVEARDGLLQFESEQVRARLVEIEEFLRTTRLQLDQARDRRGELAATAAKLQSDLTA